MSLTVLCNSCNLHPSIFEALIKKNREVKFRGLTGILYMKKNLPYFLNAYKLFSIILSKQNKNIAWEKSELCIKKK